MSAPQLPAAIATYQAAHDRHDVEAALSAFTADAAVHDEDQDLTYRFTLNGANISRLSIAP